MTTPEPDRSPFPLFVASGLIAYLLLVPPIHIDAGAPESGNPFGVMLGGGGLDVEKRIAVARDLAVPYVRPWDISLDEWKGQHGETDAFLNAGFKVILTVRSSGTAGPPPRPTSPPRDLDAYKKKLGELLDIYRPELLVVENEENSGLYYLGTPKQYGVQLRAACEVAHAKGIKCTNGGLTSSLVGTLVWNHYRTRREASKAEDFLRRSATRAQVGLLRTMTGQLRVGEAINKGKALLAEYKAAGMDYVNFHWYIPDPDALAETVEFLKAETGLQPITNEIGQRDEDPAAVARLLARALELRLPYALWFSLDRPDAKALHNPDGTLRANGLAFKNFVQEQGRGTSAVVSSPAQ